MAILSAILNTARGNPGRNTSILDADNATSLCDRFAAEVVRARFVDAGLFISPCPTDGRRSGMVWDHKLRLRWSTCADVGRPVAVTNCDDGFGAMQSLEP